MASNNDTGNNSGNYQGKKNGNYQGNKNGNYQGNNGGNRWKQWQNNGSTGRGKYPNEVRTLKDMMMYSALEQMTKTQLIGKIILMHKNTKKLQKKIKSLKRKQKNRKGQTISLTSDDSSSESDSDSSSSSDDEDLLGLGLSKNKKKKKKQRKAKDDRKKQKLQEKTMNKMLQAVTTMAEATAQQRLLMDTHIRHPPPTSPLRRTAPRFQTPLRTMQTTEPASTPATTATPSPGSPTGLPTQGQNLLAQATANVTPEETGITIEDIKSLCTSNQLQDLTQDDLRNFQQTIDTNRWSYRGNDQARIVQDGTNLYNLARNHGLRPTLHHLTNNTSKWRALATKLCIRLKRAQASNN